MRWAAIGMSSQTPQTDWNGHHGIPSLQRITGRPYRLKNYGQNKTNANLVFEYVFPWLKPWSVSNLSITRL
jgi:hypothetical protein